MEQYILGIDLGTSALKAIVVNRKGEILDMESASYDLIVRKPGYSEQNPHDWVDAFDTVLQSLINRNPNLKNHLEGLSISGQMHSLVLLDENQRVLRNAILWNDVRTTKQCETIKAVLGNTLISITKNRALEGFTLPKLLWVKENEPELFEKAKTFLLPKDYLRFCLTGTMNLDYTDGAGTLLLDVAQKKWSHEILDAFDLKHTLCPPLVESYDCVGLLSEDYKQRFDIRSDVKVFAGGADNACSAIGSGISSDGIAMCSVGTSGVFLVYEGHKDKDYKGDLHFFNHADGNFYAMGVTLSAGKSLSWFKEICGADEDFDTFLDGIDAVPVGSNGLLFTPYITGERTPYPDSTIRGSFIGLDLSHTKAHLVRAVIEGINFSLMDSKRIIDSHSDSKIQKIISVGGGAKSKTQLQIQANIFNTPVVTLQHEEGPALGAAMIAAVGLGWFENFESCSHDFVKYKDVIEPNETDVEMYQKTYNIYTQVYQNTVEMCEALSELKK